MVRTIALFAFILCITLSIGAEDVALSGTVRKTGTTTGVAGVKVSLVNIPSLSATTDAEGKFTITGTTSIQTQPKQVPTFEFNLKGNCILFSPLAGNVAGRMELFSGSGRKIFSTELASGQESQRSIILPQLSAGINVMRISIGATTLTRTFMRVGNELFMEKDSPIGSATGAITLKKGAAGSAVDTLVASKIGFTTKKTPIDRYSKQNIQIELDSAVGSGGKCTRESLKELVDKYIEAQKAGDPMKMPLAENVKVKINGKDSSMQKSILTQALKIDFHLSIYDVDSCRTFTEVIVANSTPAYVIGTRLRVKNDKITGIDAIVTDKENGWMFDAAKYLKYAKQQNWYILSANERITREKLIDAGNQYLDIFNGDDEGLPWGAPCYRIEGGMCTLGADTTKDYCKVLSKDVLGASGGKGFLIGKRDFIVDVDLGAVNVFCAFCELDSHLFRLVDGHYRYVHTLTVGCK